MCHPYFYLQTEGPSEKVWEPLLYANMTLQHKLQNTSSICDTKIRSFSKRNIKPPAKTTHMTLSAQKCSLSHNTYKLVSPLTGKATNLILTDQFEVINILLWSEPQDNIVKNKLVELHITFLMYYCVRVFCFIHCLPY